MSHSILHLSISYFSFLPFLYSLYSCIWTFKFQPSYFSNYYYFIYLIIFIIFFFYFKILYWFCHTSTWICQGCTRVPHPESPSHLRPHTIPLGHPSAPAPSILYPASNWTGNSFLIWYYTCFNAILPNHPTLSLSHRVQKTVLYICVSFVLSHTGLSLPSF